MSSACEFAQETTTVNIAEQLARMAQVCPDKPAVVCLAGDRPRQQVTFRELEQQAGTYARGLERIGIIRGTRTILMVRPSIELFALTFALFKIAAVPVVIDPGMGRQNLVNRLAEVEAQAFVGIPLAHLLRVLHRSAFKSVKTLVTVGRRYFWGGNRLADIAKDSMLAHEMAPTKPDDVAAILFTSGSTGPSKGVVYTHGIFDAQVRYLRSHFGYSPGEVDLATFPLFALFDAALGITAVIPDMDATRPGSAEPLNIIGAIQQQRCTTMFGSPALLDRVGRYGEAHGVKLPTLKRVVTAGAPAQPAMLKRFGAMLADDVEILTPYGATEALPVTSIGSGEILRETSAITARGGGTCVGKPLDGIDARIIEISDEAIGDWQDVHELPTGGIGEIAVKGPVITREYFERAEATQLAKIRDGDDVWHRMGDVGYLDERGRLWFCGRKAHRVVTEHGTLFTVPCEAVFNQHPAVRRTALVGVDERSGGGQSPTLEGWSARRSVQRPVMCVELEENAARKDREQLTAEILALGAANALTTEIRTILYHPAFPVDVRHNAKIFRERLAVWAAERVR